MLSRIVFSDPLVITAIYQVTEGNVALTTQGAVLLINHQYIYAPYGVQHDLDQTLVRAHQPLNIKHNHYGYTGQSIDPTTGLIMLGSFRNYAPNIGRFIQPDTYNSFSRQKINNAFAYVKSDPFLYTDPSGHTWDLWQGFVQGSENNLNPLSWERAIVELPEELVHLQGLNDLVTGLTHMFQQLKTADGLGVAASDVAFATLGVPVEEDGVTTTLPTKLDSAYANSSRVYRPKFQLVMPWWNDDFFIAKVEYDAAITDDEFRSALGVTKEEFTDLLKSSDVMKKSRLVQHAGRWVKQTESSMEEAGFPLRVLVKNSGGEMQKKILAVRIRFQKIQPGIEGINLMIKLFDEGEEMRGFQPVRYKRY